MYIEWVRRGIPRSCRWVVSDLRQWCWWSRVQTTAWAQDFSNTLRSPSRKQVPDSLQSRERWRSVRKKSGPPPPPSHHWVNWLSNNHFLTWPLAITGIKRGHVVWQIWLSTVSPDPPSAKYARLKWAAGAVATRTLAALDSGRKSESNYKNYIIQLLVTITRALILGIKYKSRYLERLKWVQPWNAAETINMWHASINQI